MRLCACDDIIVSKITRQDASVVLTWSIIMTEHYDERGQWEIVSCVKKQKDTAQHWYPNMPNPTHPSHFQPRANSVIDLDFKRTEEEKIVAIVEMGKAMNALGKTFNFNPRFEFAFERLVTSGIRFVIKRQEKSVIEDKKVEYIDYFSSDKVKVKDLFPFYENINEESTKIETIKH